MAISLENYIRHKLDENERMHDFALSTDTLRCWLDEHKEMEHKENNTCTCLPHQWCGICYVYKRGWLPAGKRIDKEDQL